MLRASDKIKKGRKEWRATLDGINRVASWKRRRLSKDLKGGRGRQRLRNSKSLHKDRVQSSEGPKAGGFREVLRTVRRPVSPRDRVVAAQRVAGAAHKQLRSSLCMQWNSLEDFQGRQDMFLFGFYQDYSGCCIEA